MGNKDSVSLKVEADDDTDNDGSTRIKEKASSAREVNKKPKTNKCAKDVYSSLNGEIKSAKDTHSSLGTKFGVAKESSEVENEASCSTATSSKDVTEECPRSVRWNMMGTLVRLPGDAEAFVARKSYEPDKSARKYDKRKKQLVHEVIYKQGGYIIDRKDKERRIRIEPGTQMPTERKRDQANELEPDGFTEYF